MMKKSMLADAIAAVKAGSVIVYPTDTLYALGADVYNDEAVKEVFMLKHRSFSQPLPVAVARIHDIKKIAQMNPIALRLAKRFLPGPLTLVLHKNSGLKIVSGNQQTIAVRIPNHPVALQLLKKTGPLTVTSANIHTQQVPAEIKEIKLVFGEKVSVYFDMGKLVGTPSTIVDVTKEIPQVLRKGVITENEIRDAIING